MFIFQNKEEFFLDWPQEKKHLFISSRQSFLCSATTFPKRFDGTRGGFKYEENHSSDGFLKQVGEYRFPISNKKNGMFAVFAFDLETCNVENQLL